VEVTGAATNSCSKRFQNFLSIVTYSPSYRQAVAAMMNIPSTLYTVPDLCQNISFAILFGSNGNSYRVYTQSGMCVHIYIYTHILHNIEKRVGQNK